MVVQSLPPGQFTVTNTVAVLNKLELIQEGAVARYGPGGFRWLSTVGDLSAMYDEIDPALACDKAESTSTHDAMPYFIRRLVAPCVQLQRSGSAERIQAQAVLHRDPCALAPLLRRRFLST